MKKCLIILGFSLVSSLAVAGAITGQVNLVNNFTDSLTIRKAQHSEVISYPSEAEFILPGQGGKTVLTINTSDEHLAEKNFTETYVGAYDEHNHSAFFGIELLGDKNLLVRGYIGKGIAYSWDRLEVPTIYFCTHEYFIKHNDCVK